MGRRRGLPSSISSIVPHNHLWWFHSPAIKPTETLRRLYCGWCASWRREEYPTVFPCHRFVGQQITWSPVMAFSGNDTANCFTVPPTTRRLVHKIHLIYPPRFYYNFMTLLITYISNNDPLFLYINSFSTFYNIIFLPHAFGQRRHLILSAVLDTASLYLLIMWISSFHGMTGHLSQVGKWYIKCTFRANSHPPTRVLVQHSPTISSRPR